MYNSVVTGKLLIPLLVIIFYAVDLFPQWVNNPALNTRIVVDAVKPINITSIEDIKGGAFLFWEDNKDGFQNEIYFSHLDGNGKVTFQAEGKKVSESNSPKANPVASSNLPNTAVVVWKDFSRNKNGNLYAQKVSGNGILLWKSNGVQVSNSSSEIYDYSVCSDSKGDVYVVYNSKMDTSGSEYRVIYQKLNNKGEPLFTMDGKNVFVSPFRKITTSILPDETGGAYVFWMENQNSKTTIYAQHIDSTGKNLWGKKPVAVSNTTQNVISYSVKKTDFSSIYIAWQIQKRDKGIYHQLISFNGKPLWTNGGKLATTQKGNQTNPQVLTADSTLILSWTTEVDESKDIYMQKFTVKGAPRWGSDVAVTKQKHDQFGQKLLGDGKSGAIVSWIDKRKVAVRPNIYGQRVSNSGKLLWDTSGVAIASFENTEKSYQSLISDLRGGAIAIFKETREGKSEIYAQKVFNTGTYISQIIGLTAKLSNDSVKISWYSANEASETTYEIEKSVIDEGGSSPWRTIGSLNSSGVSTAKYYEFSDIPNDNGTIYYRIVQKDNSGNIQPSDAVKIEYFESAEKIVVGQNSPNPFNGETTISFYLPDPAIVKIEFFNSHVEKISELESARYPAGENKITFSGKGLPDGIYFYKLQSGDFVDVKKMIITK